MRVDVQLAGRMPHALGSHNLYHWRAPGEALATCCRSDRAELFTCSTLVTLRIFAEMLCACPGARFWIRRWTRAARRINGFAHWHQLGFPQWGGMGVAVPAHSCRVGWQCAERCCTFHKSHAAAHAVAAAHAAKWPQPAHAVAAVVVLCCAWADGQGPKAMDTGRSCAAPRPGGDKNRARWRFALRCGEAGEVLNGGIADLQGLRAKLGAARRLLMSWVGGPVIQGCATCLNTHLGGRRRRVHPLKAWRPVPPPAAAAQGRTSSSRASSHCRCWNLITLRRTRRTFAKSGPESPEAGSGSTTAGRLVPVLGQLGPTKVGPDIGEQLRPTSDNFGQFGPGGRLARTGPNVTRFRPPSWAAPVVDFAHQQPFFSLHLRGYHGSSERACAVAHTGGLPPEISPPQERG